MSPAIERSPSAPARVPAGLASTWKRWTRRRLPAHRLLLQADGLWDAGHAGAPLQRSRWYESFEIWCATHPDTDCDLLASGTIVHDLVCEPDLPLHSDAQLVTHARAVFGHFHGEQAARWHLACWFSGHICGVCALHEVDLEGLAQTAGRHRVHVRQLLPWWAQVLQQVRHQIRTLHRTPAAWLLIVEGRFVKVLGIRYGQLCTIRAQWLEAEGPSRLARLGAQLQSSDTAIALPAVVLAVGHGLEDQLATEVQVLGRLDEAEPSPYWLLPQRGRR